MTGAAATVEDVLYAVAGIAPIEEYKAGSTLYSVLGRSGRGR